MPNRLAVPEAADRLAVFQNVGDDVKFGHALDETAPGLLDGSKVEFAESAAEGDQLGIGQLLAAKQQDQVIQPGAADRGECRLAQLPQIYPANFSSESAARRNDKRLVHRFHLHIDCCL